LNITHFNRHLDKLKEELFNAEEALKLKENEIFNLKEQVN